METRQASVTVLNDDGRLTDSSWLFRHGLFTESKGNLTNFRSDTGAMFSLARQTTKRLSHLVVILVN